MAFGNTFPPFLPYPQSRQTSPAVYPSLVCVAALFGTVVNTWFTRSVVSEHTSHLSQCCVVSFFTSLYVCCKSGRERLSSVILIFPSLSKKSPSQPSHAKCVVYPCSLQVEAVPVISVSLCVCVSAGAPQADSPTAKIAAERVKNPIFNFFIISPYRYAR